jgi:hypothetical protein
MKAGIFTTMVVLIFVSAYTTAQNNSLYMAPNIKKAYEKGARSFDGRPGKNYWVNKTDYIIKAEVFPKERLIKGTTNMKFYNNSPDSLSSLVIRLYQDIMKKGMSRDYRVNAEDITDGVIIDTVIINGSGIDLNSRAKSTRNGTNLFLRELSPKIYSNTSADIEIRWSVTIPKESRIRMGAYNDSTLYVAYWYPQIAVYDDIDGWDRQDYAGAVEFYNDINNYEVEITAPKNFVVWGTGLYKNLEEVLKPHIIERYNEALDSDGLVRIINEEDLKTGPTLDKEKLTWKFKAENVPDFTFALSSGYIWDGISAEIDDKGTRVLTDAVYPPSSTGFANTAIHAKASVEYLSKEMPAVPFPYPKITTFNGEQAFGGGMESPMMVNNGVYPTESGQLGVTLHEIAHSYFPFYMGTNERKYAWMDEGWATYFTYDLVTQTYPEDDELATNITNMGREMGSERDLPIYSLSYATRGANLTFSSYIKSSVAYHFLREALGHDLFLKALHEYINRWKGKHPIPYDFFFTFNDVAKEDLSWFWNPWFMNKHFPDLAIKSVRPKGNKTEITVENMGGVPVPVNLNVTYDDKSTEAIKHNISVWKKGNREFKLEFSSNKKITKVEVDTRAVPDADKSNNYIETK